MREDAHTIETPTASLAVDSSTYNFDAGVKVRVHTYHVQPHAEGDLFPPEDQHTAYAGITFTLTPDECDELAAALVAHAYKRRALLAAREEVAA